MLLALCVLLHGGDSATYSGRDRQLDVQIPRFEADAIIDGDLSDSVWAHAARLTGFSQYSPNDDVPAADSTQVLVWYSATAIYFGIRAFELQDRKSTRLNSSHGYISYAVFCLKKKKHPAPSDRSPSLHRPRRSQIQPARRADPRWDSATCELARHARRTGRCRAVRRIPPRAPS